MNGVVKINGDVGISKTPLTSIMNKKRDINVYIVAQTSKQTRTEASKNKVSNNQKSIKHINNLSKSK